MQNSTRLDIISLINNSPVTVLSKEYQTKLLRKIQEHFTEEQQHLFIASFYCYLNQNSKSDFVISLDSVWKWLGFSRKDHCKTVIEKHFSKDVDYKITLPNLREQVHGGVNKESILMNICTFKKLCLKSNTKKADEIHDYYIKLEELLQETMNEESQELKLKLEEKEKQIEKLENKPETEDFFNNPGYIYLIKDINSIGSYKIGLGEKPDRRLSSLNTSSDMKSLRMINMYKTSNMKYAEKVIHILLEPFRIKKRKEWFYLGDDLEVNYAMNLIKNIISCIETYTFKEYKDFKTYAERISKDELRNVKEENIMFYKSMKISSRADKTSVYNGISWSIENEKWSCRLTKDKETVFLGYHSTEFEAASTYNDYASYLNTIGYDYELNDIDGYIQRIRDVPKENQMKKLEDKSSNFRGVYFLKSKQLFEASIQYKKKSYKLNKSLSEIECAKMYNEQALYFNNHLNTSYKLNEIEDFITTEKNHISDIELSKSKKYSRFVGVSVRNDSNKFRSYIKYNGKRIDCGTFKDEIEAAKAYNRKAEELNKLESTKIKYQLNDIES